MPASAVVTLHPSTSPDRRQDILASDVAYDLAQSERSIEHFIATLGRGLANMADGRADAGLRAGFGQGALEEYVAVISHGVNIRAALTRTHSTFAREARKAGLDWSMRIPTESTPTDGQKDGPNGNGG